MQKCKFRLIFTKINNIHVALEELLNVAQSAVECNCNAQLYMCANAISLFRAQRATC